MRTTLRARRWRRATAALSLVAVGLLAGAGIASAHVSVNPSEAAAGDYTKLTFRVPNESPTAGTVAVTVELPTDHPFASVSVKQTPGWKVVPTKTTLPAPVTEGTLTIKEAVTSISWSAVGSTTIGPGEFAEFDISVGPVPDVASLSFPTTQTYDDGAVVNWDEPTPASGEEPENPAPTLTIGAASEEAGHSHDDGTATGAGGSTTESGGSPAAGETSAEPTQASVSAAANSGPATESSNAPTILAVISLVVAAAALMVAAVALRRRPAGPTTLPRES